MSAKIKKTYKSENRIQQECYMWFWNTYPELRGLLFAVPNGGARSSREGYLLKQTGVFPGVSDLIFLYSGNAYLIELKNELGSQSPAQVNWQTIVEKQNFKYYLCNSIENFQKIIQSIIK